MATQTRTSLTRADFLLARGADPEAKTKTPQGELTPLDMALKAEKKEVAERLRRSR